MKQSSLPGTTNTMRPAPGALLIVVLALLASAPRGSGYPSNAQSKKPVALSGSTWRFAVAGDSRDCGDVVMPAIAAGARAQGAAFFWHLGDFRNLRTIDADIADRSKLASESEYRNAAWTDFIEFQLRPFAELPVFLVIGNHETIRKRRPDYIHAFQRWLAAPEIVAQRLADNPSDTEVRTYYHWVRTGIDFIAMDNATDDQFDAEQMAWFEKVLERDRADPAIRTIVVGMHKPLPGGISDGHSMSESRAAVAIESGRRVYQALLRTQNEFHKNVYVLAAHSHYYMDGAFNDSGSESALHGWIVGTSGAVRTFLPRNWRRAHRAVQGFYGYLTATVNPDADAGRQADGNIRFEFRLVNKSDLPETVKKQFTPKLIDFCFDENMAKPF